MIKANELWKKQKENQKIYNKEMKDKFIEDLEKFKEEMENKLVEISNVSGTNVVKIGERLVFNRNDMCESEILKIVNKLITKPFKKFGYCVDVCYIEYTDTFVVEITISW